MTYNPHHELKTGLATLQAAQDARLQTGSTQIGMCTCGVRTNAPKHSVRERGFQTAPALLDLASSAPQQKGLNTTTKTALEPLIQTFSRSSQTASTELSIYGWIANVGDTHPW